MAKKMFLLFIRKCIFTSERVELHPNFSIDGIPIFVIFIRINLVGVTPLQFMSSFDDIIWEGKIIYLIEEKFGRRNKTFECCERVIEL